MPSLIKLMITAALYLLCPILAVQTLEDRIRQLGIGYQSLITDMQQHGFQTTELYPTAILQQLATVKVQMSDIIDEMGCRHEKEDSLLCAALLFEEQRLELDILIADRRWHEQEGKKHGAKANGAAESGRKGWVVAEAAEVMNAGP